MWNGSTRLSSRRRPPTLCGSAAFSTAGTLLCARSVRVRPTPSTRCRHPVLRPRALSTHCAATTGCASKSYDLMCSFRPHPPNSLSYVSANAFASLLAPSPHIAPPLSLSLSFSLSLRPRPAPHRLAPPVTRPTSRTSRAWSQLSRRPCTNFPCSLRSASRRTEMRRMRGRTSRLRATRTRAVVAASCVILLPRHISLPNRAHNLTRPPEHLGLHLV